MANLHTSGVAQTTAEYEAAKTALEQENILLTLQNKNMEVARKIEAQLEADQKAKEDAKIARATAQKALLGDARPTPLTGSMTVSTSETALAETRALAYRSLEVILQKFMEDIDKDKNIATLVVYHPAYYQAFPDYRALLLELEGLSGQYQVADKPLYKSVSATVAAGAQALNVLASAATLFRTETEYKVNQEEIGEDAMVSLLRKKDTNSGRKYFFPALYVPIDKKESKLLTQLNGLETAQKTLLRTVAARETTTAGIGQEVDHREESITRKEKQKIDLLDEVAKLPQNAGDAGRKELKDEIENLTEQLKIENDEWLLFEPNIKPIRKI